MTIDFDSLFRNRIESMLLRASWVQAVQSLLGLTGVSQVWSGRAGWYLWLRGAPGAYCLSFQDAEAMQAEDSRLVEGCFALKCYPCPDQAAFAGFSAEERALITAGGFDQTQTPSFEAAARIPESFYGIGTISLLLDPASSFTLLSFDSQERLVVRREAGRTAGAPAVLLRDVPGWEIGYPLFSCLVGLCAFSQQVAPLFIGVSRSAGFETVLPADGGAECRLLPAATQRSVSIGFDPESGHPGRLERIWRSRLEPEDRILLAGRLPDPDSAPWGHHMPEAEGDPALWRELATREFASDLATTCGCADHSHRHTHTHGNPGCCDHGKNSRPGF